jgi:hypothetical protein
MLKRDVRKIVEKQLRSKYGKQEFLLFRDIVNLIRVEEYHKTPIEGKRCIATLQRLADRHEWSLAFVGRTVKQFVDDGLLKVHIGEGAKRGHKRDGSPHDAYSINTEGLGKFALETPRWEDVQKTKRATWYKVRNERIAKKRTATEDVIPVTPAVLADTFRRLFVEGQTSA